ERQEIDRGARHQAERAVEQQAGDSALRRVIQDLLLVADQEVPGARDEPTEEAPVEIAEEQDERRKRQRGGGETADQVAPRPQRNVREDQTEPDRDEPRARR